MKHLGSLREFLITGRLGPLHTGLTNSAVATLLGPPDRWLTGRHEDFPNYWIYEGDLEFDFDAAKTPSFSKPMLYFQIEAAESLEGPVKTFNRRVEDSRSLVVTLDGFSGATKVAGFAAAMLDGPPAYVHAHDYLATGDWHVFVQSEKCLVDFYSQDDIEPGQSIDDWSYVQCVADIEKRCIVDAIYGIDTEPDRIARPVIHGNKARNARLLSWTLAEYLELVTAAGRVTT